MKQVYEKAWDYIKLIIEDNIGDYGVEGISENPVQVLDKLIEHHKSPTWEEIVLIWEKLGYDNVNLSERYKRLFLEGYGKNPLYVSLKDGIESNDDVYVDITRDMLNAFNLTIRFLENIEGDVV